MLIIQKVLTSRWFIMVTFLIVYFSPTQSLSPNEINKAKSGLEIGKAMAELLEKENFRESLTKIGKSIGPYLGALGPFVGLIMAFIPSQSAELAFMKNMMKAIDSRLDHVDNRFNDIERLMDWNVVIVQFGQIQQKINIASDEFQHIYTVPPAAVRNMTQLYIDSYDNDYHHSGKKLYDAIVKESSMFQENLGTSILFYTKNDRRKTQLFLRRVIQLLLKAVKVELVYLRLKNFTHVANYTKFVWTNRIQEVRRKFEDLDQQCVDNYYNQSGKDIDEYSLKNIGQTNKQFADGLVTYLGKKYFWRDWVVVAYNPISTADNHWVGVYGGHIKFRQDGRNIVVASVASGKKAMNLRRAEQEMKTVAMYPERKCVYWGFCQTNVFRRSAKDIYESLDKRDASLVTVIRSNANVAYSKHSNTSRLKFISRKPNFELMMWG